MFATDYLSGGWNLQYVPHAIARVVVEQDFRTSVGMGLPSRFQVSAKVNSCERQWNSANA
jgi:hypothetical protein